jgi:hypothetical protein
MKRAAPPLMFLMLVLGGWTGFRLASYTLWPEPGSPDQQAQPGQKAAERHARGPIALGPPELHPPGGLLAPHQDRLVAPLFHVQQGVARLHHRATLLGLPSPLVRSPAIVIAPPAPPRAPDMAPPAPWRPMPPPSLMSPTRSERVSRFAGSAWLFVRDGGAAADLAPGGMLGGSQAGVRLTFRIAGSYRRPLALSARLYAPLDRPQAAEAAVGLDWRPIAALPLHLLAERREAIGREGRSDFALLVHGGGERRLLGGRLRIDAYGQAGLVGTRSPDLFADGAVRATAPVGPVEVGAGAWGGAQPGAARLDVGPHLSARLPITRLNIRASAEWRFRIAGDAAPASGPALTIAADF